MAALACPNDAEYQRCLRAALSQTAWEAYCGSLRGYTLRGSCHDRNFQSVENKRGWCAGFWGPNS